MSSLIYVGMDVHKDSFSLCCFDLDSGSYFGETTINAKANLILEFRLQIYFSIFFYVFHMFLIVVVNFPNWQNQYNDEIE